MLSKTPPVIGRTTFTNKQWEFLNDLDDEGYRQTFNEDLLGAFLALQIRTLREANGWSQTDFESIAGKAQPTISQWEDPGYGKYSLTSLKHLAKAFDVGLLVRFVSFSELADWVVDVDGDRLCPASYKEEANQLSFSDIASGDWILTSNVEDMVINANLGTWPQQKAGPVRLFDSSSADTEKGRANGLAA